jgi:hypothetical protein
MKLDATGRSCKEKRSITTAGAEIRPLGSPRPLLDAHAREPWRLHVAVGFEAMEHVTDAARSVPPCS